MDPSGGYYGWGPHGQYHGEQPQHFTGGRGFAPNMPDQFGYMVGVLTAVLGNQPGRALVLNRSLPYAGWTRLSCTRIRRPYAGWVPSEHGSRGLHRSGSDGGGIWERWEGIPTRWPRRIWAWRPRKYEEQVPLPNAMLAKPVSPLGGKRVLLSAVAELYAS
eukprot:1194412-Prorocentrum_minimum.AAC.11